MKKRFKKSKDIVKASVARAIKNDNSTRAYWNGLIAKIPMPTKFDIFWTRFQLWKRQNQLI